MPKIRRTIGTTVDIYGEFSDPSSGEPVDPDELQLVVTDPDGELLGYDLEDFVSPESGTFYMPVLLNMRGTWHWQYIASVTGPPPKGIVLTGQLDAVPEL